MRTVAAASLALLALASCATGRARSLHPAAAVWSAGPVRWLVLPGDRTSLARVRSETELTRFVEAFWARRGEDAQTRFHERAVAADRLYASDALPGSLTDRGRALILLGAPSGLRSMRRTTPVWDPHTPARSGRVATTASRFEVWSWRAEELPPVLVDQLELAPGTMIQVVFRVREEGVELVEGEHFLRSAARAWVH